jgi:hypothetical protein
MAALMAHPYMHRSTSSTFTRIMAPTYSEGTKSSHVQSSPMSRSYSRTAIPSLLAKPSARNPTRSPQSPPTLCSYTTQRPPQHHPFLPRLSLSLTHPPVPLPQSRASSPSRLRSLPLLGATASSARTRLPPPSNPSPLPRRLQRRTFPRATMMERRTRKKTRTIITRIHRRTIRSAVTLRRTIRIIMSVTRLCRPCKASACSPRAM